MITSFLSSEVVIFIKPSKMIWNLLKLCCVSDCEQSLKFFLTIFAPPNLCYYYLFKSTSFLLKYSKNRKHTKSSTASWGASGSKGCTPSVGWLSTGEGRGFAVGTVLALRCERMSLILLCLRALHNCRRQGMWDRELKFNTCSLIMWTKKTHKCNTFFSAPSH